MLKKWFSAEEASSAKRVFDLDFIRAVAIGMVLIAHGFEFINPYVSKKGASFLMLVTNKV